MRLVRRSSRLSADTEGAALVEFALVLPFLVTLYFGVVVFTAGFDLNRKIIQAGRTAADLTGRTPKMDCTALGTNAAAAAMMLQPYDPTGTTIAVAGVTVTTVSGALQAKVAWSQARRVSASSGALAASTIPTGWTVNSIINPIPSGFVVTGTRFVMAKVEQNYVPALGTSLLGTVKLSEAFNWPVRDATQVFWNDVTTCP